MPINTLIKQAAADHHQIIFRDGPLVTATINPQHLQRHVEIKELHRLIQQQLTHMSNEKGGLQV